MVSDTRHMNNQDMKRHVKNSPFFSSLRLRTGSSRAFITSDDDAGTISTCQPRTNVTQAPGTRGHREYVRWPGG